MMIDRLNLELAKEYYRLAPVASVTLYTLLGVVLYFYWGKLPNHLLLAWAGVNFAAATTLLVAVRLFKRSANENNADKWLRIYAYLLLFQDAPWGMIGPMSFMVEDPLYHMLTLFLLGGVTAGSIITRGAIFRIYIVSLLSLLIPILITLLLQRTAVTDAMFFMTLIYLIFMLAVAGNYSASIARNIHLWLNNEALVEKLRSSHAVVEEVNQDLTQEIEHRKQIEEELVEAKERSERANQAKSQFLATVSHELRTPLNGIIGFADLLRDEDLDEKPGRYVYQINKAADTLQRIVNDILDIAAIETGHIRFYDEPFSLRAEMEDLLGIMAPLAERKKLGLRFHVEEKIKDDLSGDVSRLRQIISNLLSNALKYTETGWVSLDIRHLESRHGKELLRFSVEDTGIGINEEALGFIFKNFTRLENFETRGSDGVGLGLAIVKSLVNNMNGKLSVDSKPGKGSSFSCDLAFEQSCDAHGEETREQIKILSQQQWNKFKVLIVDDNEMNRMVLAAFLSKIGIPFSEAANGKEALELIRICDFDLVLLDIQMPDISGIDVAMKLREEYDSLPILIAVTAHAFPEQRQEILNAGFSDLLIKPIKISELTEILTKVYQSIHIEEEVEGEIKKDSRSMYPDVPPIEEITGLQEANDSCQKRSENG
jgi:signal transduction histidine kinase/DNA-binding NarL/FixJ family response regulator